METTKLIEDYLNGYLGSEAKQEVEDRMAHDREFHDMVRLHQEVNDSLRDKELAAFRTSLIKAGSDYFNHTGSPSLKTGTDRNPFLNPFVFRIAIILVFIAASGMILFSVLNKPDPDRLYTKYYHVYETDIISRSATTGLSDLDQAVLRYTQKDFTGALDQLNTITELDSDNYVAWFFRGLTCLELAEITEAVRSFETIPQSWNSPYQEHCEWYRALALLKLKKTAEAAKAFAHISSGNGYYAKQAAWLERRLDP